MWCSSLILAAPPSRLAPLWGYRRRRTSRRFLRPAILPIVSSEEGSLLDALEAELARAMQHATRTPFVLGICGAQGSGKSTIAAALAARFDAAGISSAVLSIDDLYLTKAERAQL